MTLFEAQSSLGSIVQLNEAVRQHPRTAPTETLTPVSAVVIKA